LNQFANISSSHRQHLQKLRRKEGAGAAPKADNGEGSSTPAPKTPKKRAAPGSAAKKTPGTSGRGRKGKSAVVDAFVASNKKNSIVDSEDDDDDDFMETPKKRVKKEVVKKEENSDGESVP